jgi:hypothetical protein
MNFLRNIFCKPASPVYSGNLFPGEQYTNLQVFLPDGLALARVNKAYDNYPNKHLFPWVALVEIQILTTNKTGQPTESESAKLLHFEWKIESMLREQHIVHNVLRVNRTGFRDVVMYIDSPKIKQAGVDEFFRHLSREREINFDLKKDPDWLSVRSFIE